MTPLLRSAVFATILLTGCAGQRAQPQAAAIGPATLNVADAAISGGDPDLALSVSQSVLAADPGNADAMIHEGDAYYALGRCPAALAAYGAALKVDASSAKAETGVGRCLMKTDPRAAESALRLAVRDDPGSAAAYNDLGVALDLEGAFAPAQAAYNQALAADPSMTSAEVNLGLSLAISGNAPAALQYLGPLAAGPDATTRIREDYAAALVASGRDVEARQVLSVDLPPDKVNAALSGFADVVANVQPPTVPYTPPPAPTAPPGALRIAPVSSRPLPPA